MESILGRALEYTLKHWLKSFSRDQFKLQGRTVQLYNLDLNGDVLHSSVGFPPALNVTAAKVGKLEITLPSVSNVQIEPIIVQIDRLNLVLEENFDFEPSETQPSYDDPGERVEFVYISMLWNPKHSYFYCVGLTEISVGKRTIPTPEMLRRVDRRGDDDVVVDSETTFTMLPESLYNLVVAEFSRRVGRVHKRASEIADGMTIQIDTVNLLLETRGSASRQGGATWTPPMASITIHNLLLYTTNESWEVVNLKEAREFSSNKKYIYVFKKLEWESLSIDLLPHPDMFTDATLGRSQEGANLRDEDGAKRVLFGGERFIEGISGEAYRTELNSPFGLEVQLHVTEAVCPALSEPGLRALLRFITGLYVCLNRGNVDFKAQQRSTEAAGRSLVSIVVDHIFLCIKDAEFQLELLMQSLYFSRASLSEGDSDSNLTRITVAGLFLRDTFSFPPSTLVQPSMQSVTGDAFQVPAFARSFCPPIYPLGEQQWLSIVGTPLICLHSIQIVPSPLPPSFASQTVIDCQPLMIHLQEESCLTISSFLADGIVVNPGDILPDFSVKSFIFTLKGLDLTVPLDKTQLDNSETNMDNKIKTSFAGARLQIENLFFLDSPSLKLKILNLEKDPACFCLWEDQPIDASQKKWTAGVSQLTLSLEASTGKLGHQNSLGWTAGLWRCVNLRDASIEVAMVTADGNPLLKVPPPGGIVRVGIACEQYLSNTSVEQLFFVLDLYAYFGRVSEKIAIAGKKKQLKDVRNKSFSGKLMDKIPSDTSVTLTLKNLQLQFLEPSSVNAEGMPLAQFVGDDLSFSATHRTLGGAIVVSSTLNWERVVIDCVDSKEPLACEKDSYFSTGENVPSISDVGYPKLRPVFWVHNKKELLNGNAHSYPFLDISVVHVVPFCIVDMESHTLNVSAVVSGVRLGGGVNYFEALLHRFGILGPDGGPGKCLSKGLENLQTGPLAKLFKATPLISDNSENVETAGEGRDTSFPNLKNPDIVDVTIELKDWLFALEGAQEMAERWWFSVHEDVKREERYWHTTFHTLRVNAKSCPKNIPDRKSQSRRIQPYPVELVTVGVQGLQIMKPHTQKDIPMSLITVNGVKEFTEKIGGTDLEVSLILSEDNEHELVNWEVENLKFFIRQPNEAVVTKEEVQHLTFLCKSEIDSAGRITAGVLRLFKLEGSVGQSAIDQLGNLGSEGINKIFSPEKHSLDGSVCSCGGFSPLQNLTNESPSKTMEPTLALLEEAVADSKAKINSLMTDIGTSESSFQHLTVVKDLSQKIESLQGLVLQLREQL
ncbi:putative aspartyl protease [Glycine max]|nr:putative aspartyl protease [Glycine max]